VESRELLSTSRRPKAEGENRVDVDIVYSQIVVEVLDAATGVGVAHASVTAGGVRVGGTALTDSNGLATLVLDSAGVKTRSVSVSHSNYRSDSERLRIDPAAAGPHARFELTRSVPCAGRAILPDDMATTGRRGMNIRRADGRRGKWHQFDNDELTFVVGGMLPGTYTAWVWADRQRTKSLTFELGPAGDENLVLRFEARD
jgi:hypothetical protein